MTMQVLRPDGALSSITEDAERILEVAFERYGPKEMEPYPDPIWENSSGLVA
jgi:hypothetical protein